jgi:hypothetical protein
MNSRRSRLTALLPAAILLVLQTSLPLSLLCPDGICAVARTGLLSDPVMLCLTMPVNCGPCARSDRCVEDRCSGPAPAEPVVEACCAAGSEPGTGREQDCEGLPICPLDLANCQICLPGRLSAVLSPLAQIETIHPEIPAGLVDYPNPNPSSPELLLSSHSPPGFTPQRSGFERRVALCSFLC